jgi:poly(3-hydroxybutyrate) depolymerase
MNRLLLFASLALAGVLFAVGSARAANLADFADYSRRNSAGQVILPGRLFTPPEAAGAPRPLMVFLHGSGAIGTNNTTQVDHAPDYLLDEAKRRGAYLYLPQAPTGWSSLSSIDSVATMIDRLVDDGNADPRRLYATGYSNGGGGTWNLVSRHPGRFAAALPIAGVAPATGFTPANLLGTAVFAVHARDDATVGVDRSRNVIASIITAAGVTPPVYDRQSPQHFFVFNPSIPYHQELATLIDPFTTKTYPITHPSLDVLYYEGAGGGHSGPVGMYYIPVTYDWMFSHVLPVPEPASLAITTFGLAAMALRARRASPDPAARARRGSPDPAETPDRRFPDVSQHSRQLYLSRPIA